VIRRGGGLGHFPPGEAERTLREERRKQIREARKRRERVVVDGRKFWLIRLPDAQALDYDEETA
jgi:hypothetical protein